MFEVQDLRHATLATVSRTGMVWFNQQTVTSAMLLEYYLNRIRQQSAFDVINQDDPNSKETVQQSSEENKTDILHIQNQLADLYKTLLCEGKWINSRYIRLRGRETNTYYGFIYHARCLQTLFSMLNHVIRTIVKRQLFSGDRVQHL